MFLVIGYSFVFSQPTKTSREGSWLEEMVGALVNTLKNPLISNNNKEQTSYDDFASSFFYKSSSIRKKMIDILYQVTKDTDSILEKAENTGILKNNKDRKKMFLDICDEYKSLKQDIGLADYYTDRQVFYAQIMTAIIAIEKISNYVNRMNKIQYRIFEILFKKNPESSWIAEN